MAADGYVDVDTVAITFENCRSENNLGSQLVSILGDRVRDLRWIGGSLVAPSDGSDYAVILNVQGSLIEGATIHMSKTEQAIYPYWDASGTFPCDTTLRRCTIYGVHRAVRAVGAGIAAKVVFEDCRLISTATSAPAQGRFLHMDIPDLTLRRCHVFVPAAFHPGTGVSAMGVLSNTRVDDCFFDTDLTPVDGRHFHTGISTSAASTNVVTNTRFVSAAFRPVANSLHDGGPFGFGAVALGNKAWFGRSGNGTGSATSVSALSAAPTTGTWRRGEIVFNTSPTASGRVGWICIAGGAPGVWKAFGVIDA